MSVVTARRQAPMHTAAKASAASRTRGVKVAKAKAAAKVSSTAGDDNVPGAVVPPPPNSGLALRIPDGALAEEPNAVPNSSGCYYCHTPTCHCCGVATALATAYGQCLMKRVVEVAGSKHLCAKSFLTPYCSRMVGLLDLKPGDTFVDLGSGNGSILMQVQALCPGVKCVGIELHPHNAELSRNAWKIAKPLLEKEVGATKPLPNIEVVTGHLERYLESDAFARASRGGKVAVWFANKLMPLTVTHFVSERFRRLPPGCRVMCMSETDLYPHSRSVFQSRDPEAFELFAMTDVVWTRGTVEWCSEEGLVSRYVRTSAVHPLGNL